MVGVLRKESKSVFQRCLKIPQSLSGRTNMPCREFTEVAVVLCMVIAMIEVLGIPGVTGFRSSLSMTEQQKRCLWDGGGIQIAPGAATGMVVMPGGQKRAAVLAQNGVVAFGETLVSIPFECLISLESALRTELEPLLHSDGLREIIGEEIQVRMFLYGLALMNCDPHFSLLPSLLPIQKR